MTYHRTGGKNGTRNSPRERHADKYLPNFNKKQGSGVKRKGREQLNPTNEERYKRMMGGKKPKMSLATRAMNRLALGRSKVHGRYD